MEWIILKQFTELDFVLYLDNLDNPLDGFLTFVCFNGPIKERNSRYHGG